jgi:hypothetical protein
VFGHGDPVGEEVAETGSHGGFADGQKTGYLQIAWSLGHLALDLELPGGEGSGLRRARRGAGERFEHLTRGG